MNKQVIGGGLVILTLLSFLTGVGFESLAERDMTQSSYIALGILIIAAVAWITEAVPLFVTGLSVLFLSLVWLYPQMQSDGLQVSKDSFLVAFFSDVIVLFLGGFALSAAMNKRRLDEWIASAIISRVGGSLPLLMLAVMAVTAFLSMWLSNTATAAMMLAMVLPITARMSDSGPGAKGLVLAIPFAANIGGLGTPVGSPPNAIALQYMTEMNLAPTFAEWMLIGVPAVLSLLLIAWIMLLWFFRDPECRLPVLKRDVEIKRDVRYWLLIGTVLFTAIGWMTSSFHGFSSGTVAMVPLLIFFGCRILETKDLREMPWDILLMMGGGLCLGTVINSSGLAAWLVEQLPVSGLGTYALTVIFGITAVSMASLMSNTATANLLIPIVMGFHVEPSSAPVMIGTAFACSLAMPLPVSTPPNAMAFSSGKIAMSDMIKPGLALTVIGISLALTVGYWWWDFVGLW